MPMRGGGTAGGGSNKTPVSYVAQKEPAFLTRIKQQIGYKAPATIDDKRAALPPAENDEDGAVADLEHEDNAPQIVQLGDNDLTAEQVDEYKQQMAAHRERELIAKGEGFVFKKPVKRSADDAATTSSTKDSSTTAAAADGPTKAPKSKPDAIDIAERSRARDDAPAAPPTKKPPDGRLLSFPDDEEEDDD